MLAGHSVYIAKNEEAVVVRLTAKKVWVELKDGRKKLVLQKMVRLIQSPLEPLPVVNVEGKKMVAGSQIRVFDENENFDFTEEKPVFLTGHEENCQELIDRGTQALIEKYGDQVFLPPEYPPEIEAANCC